MTIWLVGAGPMAAEYVRVLIALGQDVTVIGRSDRVHGAIAEAGVPVVTGGLLRFLDSAPGVPEAAIVATGVEALPSATLELLRSGVRRVLVEKPGALRREDLIEVEAAARDTSAEVIIGYNRRCYASALTAAAMIAADDGPTSFDFEFTEWAHRVEPLATAAEIKARWVLANSSHVLDLAFHLGGHPVELDATARGGLAWHPGGAVFVGSGISDHGAAFSYHADWTAPGRWGVEIMTRRRRLILRPLEQLRVIEHGSVDARPVELDDRLDLAFKPGLHRQVEEFLAPTGRVALCTLGEQLARWPWYETIAGYR